MSVAEGPVTATEPGSTWAFSEDVSGAHDHPTPGGSPFPPIDDYGFLSDCEVSALVASSGNVECRHRQPSTGTTTAHPDAPHQDQRHRHRQHARNPNRATH